MFILNHRRPYIIWNECFQKIFIVFKFNQISTCNMIFFIIQSNKLHAYNSCEFLSYLPTMWQFLKTNVRSSESPARKSIGGESWGEWRVYGFILITWIKVLGYPFYAIRTNMDPPFYHFEWIPSGGRATINGNYHCPRRMNFIVSLCVGGGGDGLATETYNITRDMKLVLITYSLFSNSNINLEYDFFYYTK